MSEKQWQKETWAKHVPYELSIKLDEFEADDEKAPTLPEAVAEAKYIIGLHNEGGTVSSAMLAGEYGEDDRKAAMKTIKDCRAFIKKYGKAA